MQWKNFLKIKFVYRLELSPKIILTTMSRENTRNLLTLNAHCKAIYFWVYIIKEKIIKFYIQQMKIFLFCNCSSKKVLCFYDFMHLKLQNPVAFSNAF